MADPQHDPDAEAGAADAVVEGDSAPGAGMPRWVKVVLIVGLALVVLFVVAEVAGVGGDHGPGRHGGGGDTPPSTVHENGGHKPPAVKGP